MKVNEIFESIQGEGRYTGFPMLFIRLAGCNLDCEWCDTDHEYFKEMSIFEVATEIKSSKLQLICWTGGEPLLQKEEILQVINQTMNKEHHIETNGTINISHILRDRLKYIVVSPKEQTPTSFWQANADIKVVTDLENVGIDLIQYADILMPLTTGEALTDRIIRQKVWDYCVKTGLRYSPRLQVDLERK